MSLKPDTIACLAGDKRRRQELTRVLKQRARETIFGNLVVTSNCILFESIFASMRSCCELGQLLLTRTRLTVATKVVVVERVSRDGWLG